MKMFLYASLIPLFLLTAACGDKPEPDNQSTEVELTASKTSVTFDRFGGDQTITVTSASQP